MLVALFLGLSASPASATEIYRFKGKGTAHGVGLDMAGVKVLADQGKDYSTILRTYYTGVSWGYRSDYDKIVYLRSNGTKVEMSMRDYLARLAEEPDSWPREGLRSLIVTARSYAWNKMDNGGVVPYWGQNYLESITDPTSTRPHIVAAVTDTSGKIMTYNGKAIMAAYHGNSGGKTESSEYVLGGSASTYPYLRGVNTPWTPLYAWDFSLTRAELEAIFNADPTTYIGTLYGIDLSNRAPSGRVYKARLIGSAGVKDVWGYFKFASKLGAKIGKSISSLIDIVPDDWQERLTITNPGSSDAAVTVKMGGVSTNAQTILLVPARRSRVLTVDDYVDKGAVHLELSSTQPVVAERTSRYIYLGYKGGYSDIGSRAASNTWHIAGSYVSSSVGALIMLSNPGATSVGATATFTNSAGVQVVKSYTLASGTRQTVKLNDFMSPGWITTKVVASGGIIVDRSTYFPSDGASTRGASALSRQWYFAEGFTGGTAVTTISIHNPNSSDTVVSLDFLRENRAHLTRRFVVRAQRSLQISAERYLHEGFGVRLRSTLPVAAEKAVFVGSSGRRSGSADTGTSSLSKYWYLPDGSTADASTFVLVANPNPYTAKFNIRFVTPDGRSRGSAFYIAPWQRVSVWAGSFVPPGSTFHTVVASTQPVVVEKAVYSAYGLAGSMGAPAPSKTWYFAESYTGP